MSGDVSTGERLDNEQVAAIAGAIDEATGVLPALASGSRSCGGRFRRFELDAARDDLAALAQNLNALLVLTDAVAAALWSSRARQRLDDAGVSQLGVCIESLVAASAREDWIEVADILEFEVPELIDCWSRLFESARGCTDGAAPIVPQS